MVTVHKKNPMVHAPRFRDYPNKIVNEIGMTVRMPGFKNYFGGRRGGKGEGLEFSKYALSENEPALQKQFNNRVFFVCPKTSELETNLFLSFMEQNRLWAFVGSGPTDQELVARFLKAEFSPAQEEVFQFIINDRDEGHVRPIVVRSSGLNEDAERASFAGIYKSVPLPNCHADPAVRLRQFETAVKLVYASTFSHAARSYRSDKEIPEGAEQMAVLIQNMVGRLWQTRAGQDIYHPEISFAAYSFNDMAVAGAKREDGFARLAFGLGQGVVENVKATAIRISLGKHSQPVPVGMYDVKQTLRCAPNSFYALPFNQNEENADAENFYLQMFKLEEHANQEMVGRHYSWFDGYDTISVSERGENPSPVATFSRLLGGQYGNSFVKVLRTLNELLKSYFGTNVDFEGAADFIRGSDGEWRTVLYVLQARTQIRSDMGRVKELPEVPESSVLLRVEGAVGRGNQEFGDIIYVPPEKFNYGTAVGISRELQSVGALFSKERRYLLLVPGRFGSTQHDQGIPADFSSARHTVGIGEYMKGNWEPSQGTHMFELLVGSDRALLHYSDGELGLEQFRQKASGISQGKFYEHYSFDKPFKLLIDEGGRCLIYQP